MTPRLHPAITALVLLALVRDQALAQAASDARFKRFDKNADGRLTADEFPYPVVFKQLDLDGDGALSPKGAEGIPARRQTRLPSPAPAPKADAIMNQLEPFTDPRTGERMHFVTSYILHPKDPESPHNGAWFLVRKLDGTYAHGAIYPEGGLPSGQSLHGVRTIIESPFHEERGKVWYFAGHCVERRHFHNTAWIYKATLPAAKKDKP